MPASARHKKEKHPSSAVLGFFLFVLLFTLATLVLASVFRRATGTAKRTGGSIDADDPVDLPTRVVILDAGHGGEDGGTAASDGTLEKDLNLSVTLLLADLLRADGVDVILTRETDRLLYDPTSDYHGRKKMLDLKARLEIARNSASERPDAETVFVSIHMNSYPSEKVKGLQVWYSPNAQESMRLAESVQGTVKSLLQPENDRKVKRSGSNIYLLDRLTLPAVLVECGFLTSPEDAAELCDEEYQKTLAFVLFSAITDYFADGSAISDSIVPRTPPE